MQEKSFGNVLVTRKNVVATVTLNRPEKLNALSPELWDDLIVALREVANDLNVRAVILTGAGQSFSAGGDVEKDLAPLQDLSMGEFNTYFANAALFYKLIVDMEKPVIAAINGYALGAGLDLALVCDIRIAAEDARLGEFFVRMGLTPEAGVYFLPRLIGLSRAKLLSFTGELIDAKEAERIGLVDKVVPPEKLISSAEELAERLANGPRSIGLIKKELNAALGMTYDVCMDYITRMQYQAVRTEDHREAVSAWLEKRKPVFKGK
jgi:enoyl-CoA hydratase/carnithine racemase